MRAAVVARLGPAEGGDRAVEHLVEAAQQLGYGKLGEAGARERPREPDDVVRVHLVVVAAKRGGVDVRRERVLGVGQGRERVGHPQPA